VCQANACPQKIAILPWLAGCETLRETKFGYVRNPTSSPSQPPQRRNGMSKIRTLGAIAMAAVLAFGAGMAAVSAAGKGKGAGQAIAPGQSGSSGQASAPGQTGTRPSHPETRGAMGSNCAKISDPKLKYECVRASKI
jgi:hypothetical protein